MEKIAVEDLFDLNEIIGMAELSSGILDLKRLDVSGVDDMEGPFSGMKLDMPDIRGRDTGRVKNMSRMFAGAEIGKVLGLENPDVSMVENMSYMFRESLIREINLSGWDTGNVKYMTGMFRDRKADNLNLSGMRTKNVGDFMCMFSGADIRTVCGFEGLEINDDVPANMMSCDTGPKDMYEIRNGKVMRGIP